MTARDALPVPTEHEEQCALMAWAALHEWHEPRMAMLFAIPNGGHRSPATAGRLKAEGVRAGVPDLCLPVVGRARRDLAAELAPCLWIELKRTKGGAVSPEQRAWHERLRKQGHRVEVCRGWIAAAGVVADYLDRPEVAP